MATSVKMPCECSEEEVTTFEELVGRGKEVTPHGLSGRIKTAKALAFHSVGGQVIGIAALKNPAATRPRKVFRKARAPQNPNDFPFEVGWVFISPEHRGQGLSRKLLKAVLKFARGSGVFATTRSDNVPMQKTLEKCGFVRTGRLYQSERRDNKLCLFLRPADQWPGRTESG